MAGCSCGGFVFDGICLECGRDVGGEAPFEPEEYLEQVRAEMAAERRAEREDLWAEQQRDADSFDY